MVLRAGAVTAATAATGLSREFSGSTANANRLINCFRKKKRTREAREARGFLTLNHAQGCMHIEGRVVCRCRGEEVSGEVRN